MDQSSGRDEAPPASEGYVFLSYARADEKSARAIIKLIERTGFRVWWDGLIPSGERFSAKISEALEGAGAVVVLWSANSAKSNWVQDEASFARDHQRLVPILIDGTEPPLGFRQLQCVDVSKGGLRASNPAMFKALQTIADMMDRPMSPAIARGKGGGIGRRSLMVGGAAAAGVAAAGIAGWQLLGQAAPARTRSPCCHSRISAAMGGSNIFPTGLPRSCGQLVAKPASDSCRPGLVQRVSRPQDDSRSIARKLGVASLLDGNVISEGGTVRIGIELIDGNNGFSRWSKGSSYRWAISSTCRRISQALSARRSPSARPTAESNRRREPVERTMSPPLTRTCGENTCSTPQRDEDSDRGALTQFTEAVQLDPHYAAARAGPVARAGGHRQRLCPGQRTPAAL